jgi:hypothetical protein
MLVVVPMASAASSLLSAYGSQGSKPAVQVKGATTATSSQSKVTPSGPNQLPFTGVDLAVFVAAGAGLVLIGFGVRKLARDEE